MNTRIYKDREGWNAKTEIEVKKLNENETLVLSASTSKFRSGVSTFFSVCTLKDEGDYTSRTHVIFQDYSKRVEPLAVKRATEKSIALAHDAALGMLDSVLAEVKTQYQV